MNDADSHRQATPSTAASRWMRFIGAVLLAVAMIGVPVGLAGADGNDSSRHGGHCDRAPSVRGMVITESEQTFDATWNALIAALEANPNINIVATVDHAATAAGAGLELEPNRVVVFGNPALGTPVMVEGRTAGLDLPQKMQVWKDDDRVFVGYNSVEYLAARHDAGDAATLDTIAAALAGLAATATATGTGDQADCAQQRHHDRRLHQVARRPGIATVASDADFETTWGRLLGAIEASPASIAFTVDHSANSGDALPPTRLIVFGNPNLGTPLMQQSPTAGIDLPLKILVWEDADGVTQVSTTNVRFLQQRHRLRHVRPSLTAIDAAISNFVGAATATL